MVSELIGPRLLYLFIVFWRLGPKVQKILVGENIDFTDALGRQCSLPLRFSRNWNVWVSVLGPLSAKADNSIGVIFMALEYLQ